MSVTIREVATSLGVSERAVRLRLDALHGILAPHLQRGPNNQLLFTGEAVAILRQAEEVRHRDGVSVKVAAAKLRQSAQDSESARQTSVRPTANRTAAPDESWAVSALIEEKDRTIRRLETENERLRGEVDRLLPLALPAPRRRSLWPFGRRAVSR
jgi:DNA-binding transcriptional MerR regulator